jgi:hypothetical protein
MANYDLTTAATSGVSTTTLNDAFPSARRPLYVIQKIVDINKLITDGVVNSAFATGDTLQIMDVPAKTVIVGAGAEVLAAFTTGTVLNIGLDADTNDDNIVDGQSATAVGFLAAGTNGTLTAGTGNARVATADTVKVTMTAAAVAAGKLSVYLVAADISDFSLADEVDRDQLA